MSSETSQSVQATLPPEVHEHSGSWTVAQRRKLTPEDLDRLEIFPRTAIRVQQLAQDPDSSFEDLERCIATDPVLGARILRVANSPYYRVPRAIGSLKHAIALMGLREVQRVALTVAMRSTMETSPLGEPLWHHAVSTACVARRVAQRLRLAEASDIFVAGILHDLGQLVMVQVFGPSYISLLDRPDDLLARETERFQMDHASLGACVLERWKLPAVTVRAVEYHHALDALAAAGPAGPELVVAVADEIAHLAEQGWSDDEVAARICDHPCNERLRLEPVGLVALLAEARSDAKTLV